MTQASSLSRTHLLICRLDAWGHRGPVRSLLVKATVTVVGPLVVVAGVAMLVLPGPGLVVIALGMGLLALEYPWARQVMRLMGRALSGARDLVLPKDGSRLRRVSGVATVAVLGVATTALTAAVTTFVGSQAML